MKRRDFLKTVAGTGATILTAASASRVYGANNRVNVALIGCGTRGTPVASHMANVDGVEIGAVTMGVDSGGNRAVLYVE